MLIDSNFQLRQSGISYDMIYLKYLNCKKSGDLKGLKNLISVVHRDALILKENNIFEALRFDRLAQHIRKEVAALTRRRLFKLAISSRSQSSSELCTGQNQSNLF